MDSTLVLCLVTALCFCWPLISKQAEGVDSAWTAFIVSGSAALVALVEIIRRTSPMPTIINGAWLTTAGLMLGVGMLMYAKLYAPPYHVSQTGPLIIGLMAAILGVGGALIYGDPISLRKCIGILGAIVVAALLA